MQQDEQQEDEKTAIPLLVLRARSKEYVKKKALKTKGQSANLIEDNYGKDSIVEWMQRTGFGVGINTVFKVHYDWSELHYKFQDSFSLHIIVTILMKPNEQLKLNVI